MPNATKKNTYYAMVFQRRNALKDFVYAVFFGIASVPRLVLEVFIRRNMGERYFSLFTAGLILLGLVAFPFFIEGRHASFSYVIGEHKLWYLFAAAFAFCSFLRWREVATLPSVFELQRFSLSTGHSLPFFYNLGDNSLVRITVLEPGFIFAFGVLLLVFKQFALGGLLMGCSLIYSLSHLAAHYQANDYIMDKMDELICKAELHRSFIEEKDPRETKGFEFIGSRPKDAATRERVADTFWDEDDAPEVL